MINLDKRKCNLYFLDVKVIITINHITSAKAYVINGVKTIAQTFSPPKPNKKNQKCQFGSCPTES